MNTINDIDQVIKPLNEFKAVIVLYGKDHSGKTLTLEQVPKFFANVRQNNKTRYTINQNNNTIVICTAGDKEDTIVSNINFAVNQKADIFVTAARISEDNRSKVLDAIEVFVENVRGCCTVTLLINKKELNQRIKKSLNTGDIPIINATIANQIANIIKLLV